MTAFEERLRHTVRSVTGGRTPRRGARYIYIYIYIYREDDAGSGAPVLLPLIDLFDGLPQGHPAINAEARDVTAKRA